MDGLSFHIKKLVMEDQFQTLKMGNNISISHNLFVDDILIMGMICRFSWLCLFHIFSRFANATGLHMNVNKSILYHGQRNVESITNIKCIFGIEAMPIQNGMKYLRYCIKYCCYIIVDWKWLADRVYKRIFWWEFRWLSLGGRDILTQAVLSQMGIYWANLFYIPTSIINYLNHLMTNIIWGEPRQEKSTSWPNYPTSHSLRVWADAKSWTFVGLGGVTAD